MLKHVSFTTYYPQGNGQAKFINKVLGRLLINVVSENKTDWDEHLTTMVFSYITIYKVATRYTPYQLMYGLHPLMPIEYIMPVAGGNEKDSSTSISTNRITKLEKFQEVRMHVTNTT